MLYINAVVVSVEPHEKTDYFSSIAAGAQAQFIINAQAQMKIRESIKQVTLNFFDFEFCTVGFNHIKSGEEIGIYVVEGSTELSDEQILEMCSNSLPENKLHRKIIRGPEIPKTSTGKIKRKQLASLF